MKHLFFLLLLLFLASVPPLLGQYTLPPDAQTGLAGRAYQLNSPLIGLPQLIPDQSPNLAFISPKVAFKEGQASGTPLDQMSTDFYLELTGWIKMTSSGPYKLRLSANEGARIYIDDTLAAEIGPVSFTYPPIDAESSGEIDLIFDTNPHPIRIESFNRGGDFSLRFEWFINGINTFGDIPDVVLFCQAPTEPSPTPGLKRTDSPKTRAIPGDGLPLSGVHPAWDLEEVDIPGIAARVTGLDFFPDGRMVFSNWDAIGGVYLMDSSLSLLASGLSEPMGVKVLDNQVYVLQRDEITQLVDLNGDGQADEFRRHLGGWPISTNERAMTSALAHDGTDFYIALTQATNSFGTPMKDQNELRGSILKVGKNSIVPMVSGLYAPLGIGIGKNNRILSSDQPEPYTLAAKVHLLGQDAPVLFLPKGSVAEIPTQALELHVGPYQGQWILGDMVLGGLKRLYLEEVDGQMQGCVFRFSEGFEGGISRLVEAPDGSIYAGELGLWKEWSQPGHRSFGIQKLSYTGDPVFEMQEVHAKKNGIELLFSEAIAMDEGEDPQAYEVFAWNPSSDSVNLETLPISSLGMSTDRRTVSLQLERMKAGHVLIIHIRQPFVSAKQHSLWSTEAWYSLNRLPYEALTISSVPTQQPNTLSAHEEQAGWQLLFDGQTTTGWRNFGKEGIAEPWQVLDGALTLTSKGGGDIITEQEYENFELSLEWKISETGNSGLFFHVKEGFDKVWHTGPEVQILDDLRHPDNALHNHRAGSNYDLYPAAFEALNPVGEFNHMKLIVNQGHVEHWLNGYKVVEYDLWTPEWEADVQKSKFSKQANYGREKSGHIALQDHGDRVAFRNIKIREIKP